MCSLSCFILVVRYPKVASWDTLFQGCVSRVLLTLVGSPPSASPAFTQDPNSSVDTVPVAYKPDMKPNIKPDLLISLANGNWSCKAIHFAVSSRVNLQAVWSSGLGARFELWWSWIKVPLWPQYAGFVPSHPWLNAVARLLHSALVCLLPVEILNQFLFSWFELFGSTKINSVDCLEISSRSYFCRLTIMVHCQCTECLSRGWQIFLTRLVRGQVACKNHLSSRMSYLSHISSQW